MSRKDGDNYPTEEALVHHLLSRVRIAGPVLEPAAGEGSIARPLKQAGLQVLTNDIAYGHVVWMCGTCGHKEMTQVLEEGDIREYEPENSCKRCREDIWLPEEIVPYDCDLYLDATERELWYSRRYTKCKWVVTNPPYSFLDEILEFALEYSVEHRGGVAMLLRVSALEPAIRRSTRGHTLIAYVDHLRHVMPFSAPRPSFTTNGKTDSVTTAWFVWDLGWSWESLGISNPFQFITDWKQPIEALPQVAGGN